MKQLTLSEIWIYPIKSLGGIKLLQSQVFEKGLAHDRRWMLIDENGIFLTQRIHPVMALFNQSIAKNELVVEKRLNNTHSPSVVKIKLDAASQGQTLRAKIWDDEVEVIEVDKDISAWFTLHMNLPCRLVTFPEQHTRTVDKAFSINNENVSLADAYPFLIIGQASLDNLNEKLDSPLPMNRFRPNFVYTGGAPHEEDEWRSFTIGKNRFAGVKPCARCVLTTIDQETTVKGSEPLVTLATYRKRNNKIYFGQNLIAIDHLEVAVGDTITLMD